MDFHRLFERVYDKQAVFLYLFPGSSTAERAAVNREAAGSNPALGVSSYAAGPLMGLVMNDEDYNIISYNRHVTHRQDRTAFPDKREVEPHR